MCCFNKVNLSAILLVRKHIIPNLTCYVPRLLKQISFKKTNKNHRNEWNIWDSRLLTSVTNVVVLWDVGSDTLQTPGTFISINPQDGSSETSVFMYSISLYDITSQTTITLTHLITATCNCSYGKLYKLQLSRGKRWLPEVLRVTTFVWKEVRPVTNENTCPTYAKEHNIMFTSLTPLTLWPWSWTFTV